MASTSETPAEAVVPGITTTLLWCLVFALIATLLQLAQPVWYDSDTAYHLAVGRLTREHGVLHAFPWTPYSWLADHYTDKELAFHLLLAALADLPPNLAAKIVGAALGTALLSVAFLVLRAERVRSPGLWVLLGIACSGIFIIRFAMVRPHLLSVTLVLALPWAAVRGRYVLVGALALAYPWCHVGWITAIGVVVLAEIARLAAGDRPQWRPLVAAVAGLSVGLLVHPNFPHIVQQAWVEIGETLMTSAWGKRGELPIGGEFQSLSLLSTLRFVLLPALLTVLASVLAVKDRTGRPVPLAYALCALVFLGLTLSSQRFLEFLAPLSGIAAGLALGRSARPFAPIFVGAAVIYTALVSQPLFRLLLNRTDMFPPKVAARLQQTIPSGAQVFTCDWQFTGEMMLALPDRRFLVALNPILFLRKDPQRFREWVTYTRRPPRRPARWVRERFRAHYVLCADDPQWRPFLARLWRDDGARLLGAWGPWVVFEMVGVQRPS